MSASVPGRVTGSVLARMGLLASIWGASFLFIAWALEGMTDTQVALGRVLFGTVALWIVLLVRRDRPPRGAALWAHLTFLGVLSNLVPFYLFAWAVDGRVATALAGVFNAATPLMTVLVALTALPEERPTGARSTGLLLGFAGVVVVMAPWQSGGTAGTLSGELACLGAAVCYGISIVYTRRFVTQVDCSAASLAAGQVTVAALIGLALTPLLARDAVDVEPKVVIGIVTLGALGTGIAYLLFYGLIREVGATTASTVTYLVPVVAVALGVMVRGEDLGWHELLGAVLVIAGIAIAEGRIGRRTPMAGGPAVPEAVDAA